MSGPRTPPPAGQAGFTIVEAMVACALLLVGLVATLTLVENAASTTQKTRTREQATSLQRELVEAARSVSYDQLTPDGIGAAVRTRPALGDAAGGAGWTIRRRNAEYTVSMGVCTVDDPRDGIGAREAGVFCAAGATPGAPQDANADGTIDALASPTATTCASSCDTTPADYKRVVSWVRWQQGAKQVANVQTTQVNNPGLSGAPAVTSLAAPSLTMTPPTVTTTDTSLAFTATTTGAPQTVALFQDGAAIGNFTAASANAWNATWTLGAVSAADGAQPGATELLDGSYEMTAKAFDQYGQFGATRSQVIVLNRRRHFAPLRVEAGRNGAVVEIEWSAAKEQDSLGFKVERRMGSGSWAEVCELRVRTACRDASPPPVNATPSLSYRVVGYDRDGAGAERAGDATGVATVVEEAPPGTPGSLTATRTGQDVALTWTAPAGTVPDHYNIYRDGQAYGDRLDSAYIAPGGTLRFVDTATTNVEHDYWITAVNGQLTESAQLGPVRR